MKTIRVVSWNMAFRRRPLHRATDGGSKQARMCWSSARAQRLSSSILLIYPKALTITGISTVQSLPWETRLCLFAARATP